MMGELDITDVDVFLKEHCIGRLGCHSWGKTYVVPISYAYDNDVIFAHSRYGMKIEMMRTNPKVCFEVDALDNMANWKSVICWGHFVELKDEAGRKKAMDILLKRALPLMVSSTVKLTSHWPFGDTEKHAEDSVFFCITIEKKTGRYERSGAYEYYAT